MDPNCANAAFNGIPVSPPTPQPNQSLFSSFIPDIPLPSFDDSDISNIADDALAYPPTPQLSFSNFGGFLQDLPLQSVVKPEISEFANHGLVSPQDAIIMPNTNNVGRGLQIPHTPQHTPQLPPAQHPKASNARSAPISPVPMEPQPALKTHTPQTPQLMPNPHAQLPGIIKATLATISIAAMAPPLVVKTPAPIVQTPTSVFKTPTHTDIRAHTGLHLPLLSPTPSATQTPTDMRAATGLHLPLLSPTPSAPSTVSSQNSVKLDNLTAFQKSQALFKRNQEAQLARQDQEASGNSKSAAPLAPASKKRTFDTSLEEDRDFMANLTQGDGEDHSWMEEADDDEDEELTKLTEQFQVLNAKQKRGTITGNEKLLLLKAESRLLQINRLRRGDEDEEDEDSTSL